MWKGHSLQGGVLLREKCVKIVVQVCLSVGRVCRTAYTEWSKETTTCTTISDVQRKVCSTFCY